MVSVLTPSEIWKNFVENQIFDEEIISTKEVDNITVKELYFNAYGADNQNIRVYGVLGTLKNALGTIIYIPNIDESFNYDLLLLFTMKGYNFFYCNLKGNDGSENYTKYPESLNYCNYSLVKDNLFTYNNSVLDSCWIQWAAIGKNAIGYIKSLNLKNIVVMGNKFGGDLTWMVSAFESRIVGSVILKGCGWLTDNILSCDNDDKLIYFRAGLEAQNYAQFINCPILYLNNLNENQFHIDDASKTLSLLKCQYFSYFSYSSDSILDNRCLKNIDLFLGKLCAKKDINIYNKPNLTFEVVDDQIRYSYLIDSPQDVSSIQIVYSSNHKNEKIKVWKFLNKVKVNKEGFGSTIRDIEKDITFEEANMYVKYKNGLYISSNYLCKTLELTSNKSPVPVLYNSNNYRSTFDVIIQPENLINNTFFNGSLIKVLQGPSDIYGISSDCDTIISYSIQDYKDSITDKSLIKFDFFSKTITSFDLIIFANGRKYSKTLTFNKEKNWQNYIVSIEELADNLEFISEYDKIEAIGLYCKKEFILNNLMVIL